MGRRTIGETMGYFYFPDQNDLRQLSSDEVSEIEVGCANLKNKLKWGFENPYEYMFYEDKNMTTENGILGYTKKFSDKILLSPVVVSGLKWKDKNGIPNNETVMGVVIHELTHRHQMKWLFGLTWPIFNIPFIDVITIEKWARQNEQEAIDILSKIYDDLRRGN